MGGFTSDMIADVETGYRLAHLAHNTADLMAENAREPRVGDQ